MIRCVAVAAQAGRRRGDIPRPTRDSSRKRGAELGQSFFKFRSFAMRSRSWLLYYFSACLPMWSGVGDLTVHMVLVRVGFGWILGWFSGLGLLWDWLT